MNNKSIRGRKYIPHGYCNEDDTSWVPHNMPIDPIYTDIGPDWSSSIRHIPSPKGDERKRDIALDSSSRHQRTFHDPPPYCNYFVWTSNGKPIVQETGKRCIFNNTHMNSQYSGDEITDRSRFGSKRKLNNIDTRNGFEDLGFGDKGYQAVEYSPGFYKDGVSVPVVPFGRPSRIIHDTFIPIFPFKKGLDYNTKQKELIHREDIVEVENLKAWKPGRSAMEILYTNPFPVKGKVS